MEQSLCSECNKDLSLKLTKAKCFACKAVFCEKHAKTGSQKETLCRKCFKKDLRKYVIKEYSDTVLALSKVLRTTRHQRMISKIRLDKKENSRKLFEQKLLELKEQHTGKIVSITDQIKKCGVSYKLITNAASNLKSALFDMKKCENRQKLELLNTIPVIEKLGCKKTSLNNEISMISRLWANYLHEEKNYIAYNRLKTGCCIDCISRIMKKYKKILVENHSCRRPKSDRINKKRSLNSLPDYPSEACRCIII